MGITLDKLEFDSSVGAPNVASLLHDSSGNGLSSTSGSLDVNVTNSSLTVTATDLDIRDLSASQDNVAISDGTDTLAINADGSININDNGGSITVDATDLDIRDLSHTQDSVQIGDGTDLLAVNADGSLNVNLTDDGIADDAADSGNPIKVGGRAIDFASVPDEADAADRVDMVFDLYRNQMVTDSRHSFNTQAVSVTNTATKLPTTALNGRSEVTFQNLGSKPVYFGHDNTVTTSNGMQIPKGASATYRLRESADIYLIAPDAGPHDVRIFEAV